MYVSTIPEPANGSRLRRIISFFDERVEVGWQADEDTHKDETVYLSSGVFIYPGMWVFTGPVIQQIERRENRQARLFFVDVDSLNAPVDFCGKIETCSVMPSKMESVSGGQDGVPVQQYQANGVGFDEQAKLWLDEHDMLVNYSDEHKHVVLTRYAPFRKTRP